MDKETLQFLKEEYCKTIPIKVDQVRVLIDSLKADWSLDNLRAFRFHVHKIAGSAGSYGYTSVTELCKLAEQLVLSELDHVDPLPVNKELLMKLDQFFESLKQGFDCERP